MSIFRHQIRHRSSDIFPAYFQWMSTFNFPQFTSRFHQQINILIYLMDSENSIAQFFMLCLLQNFFLHKYIILTEIMSFVQQKLGL